MLFSDAVAGRVMGKLVQIILFIILHYFKLIVHSKVKWNCVLYP